VPVPPASPAAGRTLAELDLRRSIGIAVAAVRRGATLFPNPEAEFLLQQGDVLIVAGARAALESFERAMLSPA
jgi:uncharacterized protein with PhoU and TrkA domain